MDARLFILLAFFLCVNAEYVNKKFCKDVNPDKCSIHSVKVDPCPDGPGFCFIRRDKIYSAAIDFTPRFEAQKLKLSIISDAKNNGTFDTIVTPPSDACQHHACPLEDNVRQVFEVDFIYRKKTYGKIPMKFMLWNENDQDEACCFTFNVKMLK